LDVSGSSEKAIERDRRPTLDELDRIVSALEANIRQQIPVGRIIRFAVATAMRQDEIARVEWRDFDASGRMLLIRNRKDSRKKKGNDQRIPLLDVSGYDACKIIEEQGRFSNIREGRIFPYNGRSVGTAFRRQCRNLKIDDLHFHDCKIGRRHVKTLMRRMGIEALYRRPRTTRPEPGHKIYPYLLRGMEITRPNQVWAMDITYIPMARGFVYLAVVLDWATRRVLSWRLSITMEAAFCVETLEDALARYGKPDNFNTDQGSQFTGAAFTGVLTSHGIAISMDGKGAWRDNVFVERLWRSVKYEEVYLRAYETVGEARASIGRYLDFYNGRRPHSSLDGRTPDQAYFNSLPLRLAA
jgi:putative transposase